MRLFTSAARKQLPSNIFSLALSNIFRWSNLRASFVGSLASHEYRDTIRLFNRVQRAYERSPYSEPLAATNFVQGIVDEGFRRARRIPHLPLQTAVRQFVRQLLDQEPAIFAMPPPPRFDHLSTVALHDLRRILLLKERTLDDPARYVDLWRDNVICLVERVARHIPPLAFSDIASTNYHVPLIDLCEDAAKAIESAVATVYHDDIVSAGFFDNIRSRLDDNLCHASGMTKDKAMRTDRSPVFPTEARGKTPREIVAAYLSGTPLEALFSINIPFDIPQDTRYSGMWIVAPPKRGKTTLLTTMFLQDLRQVAQNKASIIVLDSKGDLIQNIRRLRIFAPGELLAGKMVIIDPDPDHPLALNPLDITDGIPQHLSTGQRKLLANRAVSLLEYLFTALLDAEATMSGPQSRFFRAVIRAILEVVPNPTLHTFYDMIANGFEKYEPYLSKLEDRSFFSREQFYSSTLKATRESLVTRLGLLLDNYAIASMFKSPTTKLNLAKEMDSGKVIIINNSKPLLEDAGAEFFGRFFLYLMRKAAERRSLNTGPKMPVFCYVDEAHNVIKRDENIATIIQECRSQNIAMLFAHQSISQIDNDKVRSALADCAIIFANSRNEAAQLAPRVHAETPEFLHQPIGTFAAYIADETPKAIALKISQPPPLQFMTQQEEQHIISEMRRRYCIGGSVNYQKNECDLEWEITISPRMAEQGGKKQVNDFIVSIPAGTKHCARFRLKGKGGPKPDGTFGDLYITVNVPPRPNQRTIASGDSDLNEWG
jgi:hypothetical protein